MWAIWVACMLWREIYFIYQKYSQNYHFNTVNLCCIDFRFCIIDWRVCLWQMTNQKSISRNTNAMTIVDMNDTMRQKVPLIATDDHIVDIIINIFDIEGWLVYHNEALWSKLVMKKIKAATIVSKVHIRTIVFWIIYVVALTIVYQMILHVIYRYLQCCRIYIDRNELLVSVCKSISYCVDCVRMSILQFKFGPKPNPSVNMTWLSLGEIVFSGLINSATKQL